MKRGLGGHPLPIYPQKRLKHLIPANAENHPSSKCYMCKQLQCQFCSHKRLLWSPVHANPTNQSHKRGGRKTQAQYATQSQAQSSSPRGLSEYNYSDSQAHSTSWRPARRDEWGRGRATAIAISRAARSGVVGEHIPLIIAIVALLGWPA